MMQPSLFWSFPNFFPLRGPMAEFSRMNTVSSQKCDLETKAKTGLHVFLIF